MNSKKSLFNKTIIKNNLKRFWWIGVLYIVVLALFILPNVANEYNYGGNIYNATDEGFLAMFFGGFTGIILFSYLHNGKAVSSFHGIPITRVTLYFSNCLSAIILVGLPIIIGSISMGIECMYLGIGIKMAVKYFYTACVYGALIFTIATFSSIISGNTVASFVFTIGFIILPAFLILMVDSLFSINLYGYFSGNSDIIISYIYIDGIENMWSKSSLIYIVLIVILFVLGLWLYKKRELEYFDEIVVFKPLKSVFMITVTTCFALFGYFAFYNIFNITNIFCGIPLGLVALVAVHMINNKSFSLKGILKPVILFVLVLAVVYVVFAFDGLGFEKRIPDVNNIESIDTFGSQPAFNEEFCSEPYHYEDIAPRNYVTNKEDIENIVSFHKAIVSRKEIDNNQYNDTVYFKYNLKDGSVIERRYSINTEDYEQHLKLYYNTDYYKKMKYPITDDYEKVITSVVYEGIGSKNDTYLKNIDYDKLLNAIKTDVNNLSGDDLIRYKSYGLNIISIHYDEFLDYNGRKIKFSLTHNIPVDNYFKETSKIVNNELKNHMWDFIKTEDIIGMEISDNYMSEFVEVNNSKEAQEIYSLLKNLQVKPMEKGDVLINISIDFKTKGYIFDNNFLIPYKNVPNEIKKYINGPKNTELNNDTATMVVK